MADKSKLQEILEMGDSDLRSYSGRCMYGKSCLGVDIDQDRDLGDLFAEVLEGADEDDLRELAETFRQMRTDSMGRGTIVYFPGTEFVDDSPPECDGCGEEAPSEGELCAGCKVEALPVT